MKIKFDTTKVTSLGDYFNFGFQKDEEEDYCLCIMLFGRDFVWRFFKKDSQWSIEEDWDQA